MVFTIGHSTRSINELIKLLKKYNIDIIADVRRFPGSKKYPHFNKENLDTVLGKHFIKYFWLGEHLGGFRKGGYEGYTKTDEFRKGIEDLLEIIKQGTVAIMCAEIVWFRCHRRYISDKLVLLGFEVIHIVDEKRTYAHKLR
ncbi:MAG: DUF488 family protein [Promethearchaeota archaeon]